MIFLGIYDFLIENEINNIRVYNFSFYHYIIVVVVQYKL